MPRSYDRSLLDSRRPLPATLSDWLRAASADPHVYAEAACQVSRWAGTSGGKEALLTLIKRLPTGQAFPGSAYHAVRRGELPALRIGRKIRPPAR